MILFAELGIPNVSTPVAAGIWGVVGILLMVLVGRRIFGGGEKAPKPSNEAAGSEKGGVSPVFVVYISLAALAAVGAMGFAMMKLIEMKQLQADLQGEQRKLANIKEYKSFIEDVDEKMRNKEFYVPTKWDLENYGVIIEEILDGKQEAGASTNRVFARDKFETDSRQRRENRIRFDAHEIKIQFNRENAHTRQEIAQVVYDITNRLPFVRMVEFDIQRVNREQAQDRWYGSIIFGFNQLLEEEEED